MDSVKNCSFILLFSSTLMSIRPAHAEPRSADDVHTKPSAASVVDAQNRFRRGLELYEEGNLGAAIAEMKRAYRTAPNFKVLYNIGQISFELHDYAAAVAAFEAYLAEGGKEVTAERRRQVEREIAKLKERLALVEVSVNVPGAEVAIDEELAGISPLGAPVVVSAGRHKISAGKPGYVAAYRQVELAGGDSTKVTLELGEEHAPLAPPVAAAKVAPASVEKTAAAAPVSTPDSRGSRSRPALWVGWTVTGGLAVGTMVLEALAWRAAVDLRDERRRFGTTSATLNQKRDKVEGLSLAADLGLAATAAAGGLTLIWSLSGGAPASDSARIEVSVSPSSWAVRGAF